MNEGGVNRTALQTFLEGQGSPSEQCALLVYLLRKAGVPCGYVYGPHNGLFMFDQQMSEMLHMQLRGAQTTTGSYNVPTLIPVNYPWVAAKINGQWQNIFPWIKDTSIVEGFNLNGYLPSGYNSGRQWLYKYLLDDRAIRGLSSEYNTPGRLFPMYVRIN
ncbi:MAG: transglutaminase domain-containing protein [Chthoniobacteraceae bacterium]